MGGPKNSVGQISPITHMEMRVDILPHDFPFGSDLKHAPKKPLGNQCITVGQSPGPGDKWTKKVKRSAILIAPYDLVILRVYFQNT